MHKVYGPFGDSSSHETPCFSTEKQSRLTLGIMRFQIRAFCSSNWGSNQGKGLDIV